MQTASAAPAKIAGLLKEGTAHGMVGGGEAAMPAAARVKSSLPRVRTVFAWFSSSFMLCKLQCVPASLTFALIADLSWPIWDARVMPSLGVSTSILQSWREGQLRKEMKRVLGV